MNTLDRVGALVLAAGKGTRMRSPVPKVLHTLLEEPLLGYSLSALSSSGIKKIAVVTGSGAESVERYLHSSWPGVEALLQADQKGTGHAVKVTEGWWGKLETLLVLPGDAPFLTSEALQALMKLNEESNSSATLLSFETENPTGYGRIIRRATGCRIVEEKDAKPEEKEITEVNSGIYAFRVDGLSTVIGLLENRNAQGEYYLPDVLPLLSEKGFRVEAGRWPRPEDLSGINDPLELAAANRKMRDRILRAHLIEGVKVMDPETTWIGPSVTLGADVRIEADVQIWGRSLVEKGASIGSHSILRDASIREDAQVLPFCCLTDCEVGSRARVGPFACIRDKTKVGQGALVGKFVEVKNSFIGEKSKVPHLSYMGDATVGRQTNIGAGTITCNYDGKRKNPTRIGDNCFVGSDTMLIAPVTLHDGCFTAAGSAITEDVPQGALAVGRARQRNIEGWARRKGTDSRKEDS